MPREKKTMDDVRYPLLSLSRLRMGTDGNGVTTLVAGAGCPLHCRWCINGRLLRDPRPERITPEELLERVKVDDLYFRATGGGITFGGGESLLHAEFIRRFRELIPAEWKVSAETSLAVPEEQLLTVLCAVDLFIVDCKDMNEETYRRYTGWGVLPDGEQSQAPSADSRPGAPICARAPDTGVQYGGRSGAKCGQAEKNGGDESGAVRVRDTGKKRTGQMTVRFFLYVSFSRASEGGGRGKGFSEKTGRRDQINLLIASLSAARLSASPPFAPVTQCSI